MLSGMNEKELRREIRRIKREMARLGPMRPGTLYMRENVCGRAGCRCGRKRDPVKHGPYHYVSYTYKGKSHTEFVRQGQVGEVKVQIANYERFMGLVRELVELNLQLCRAGKEKR